jgi:hypothetical protein
MVVRWEYMQTPSAQIRRTSSSRRRRLRAPLREAVIGIDLLASTARKAFYQIPTRKIKLRMGRYRDKNRSGSSPGTRCSVLPSVAHPPFLVTAREVEILVLRAPHRHTLTWFMIEKLLHSQHYSSQELRVLNKTQQAGRMAFLHCKQQQYLALWQDYKRIF